MKTNGNGHAGNGHGNGHAGNGHTGFGWDEPPEFPDDEPEPVANPWVFDGPIPTVSWWLDRDLPPRDNLMGELLSTTSRVMLVGPTGLGKTNFGLALANSLATNRDFLHWQSVRQARVLYIDGEMPNRLIKRRLADTVRRAGCQSDNLVLLSREDYPNMPPLNSPEGQRFIDEFMAWAGPFDINFFDNIQALLTGEMKDPEQWSKMLNWVRDLTHRSIGQVWVHHTGHDEGRSYGDKTREWQMDTVMLLERAEDPSDIAFNVKFPKARERSPDNRSDFEEAMITLAGDQWTSSRGGAKRGRPRKVEDIAIVALQEALDKLGETPPGHSKIPFGTMCVKREAWKGYFERDYAGDEPRSVGKRFGEVVKKLQLAGQIGFSSPWVWRLS